MAHVTLNPKFEFAVTRMLDSRLKKVAADLKSELRKEVSTPYPPASQPGEAPHMRTGGLKASVFMARVRMGEYAIGFRRVKGDPAKPNSNRELLGIWTELGTGTHRNPFPEGSSTLLGVLAPGTAETGSGGSSMAPRPVLVPLLLKNRAKYAEQLTRGGMERLR